MSTNLIPRPVVDPPGPWAFPAPSTWRCPNGLNVLAFDVPGQYVASVRVVIPLTLAVEPRSLEGIASMTARLLDEGTARHTGEEFALLMERHGMALGAGVSDGGLHVDVDVPTRLLGPALDLLTQALAEPSFPEDEVRRILRNRVSEYEHERASAPHRAARELIATLYAASDRASRPTAGTPETVSAITREDLVGFHQHHVGPEGASVIIAGDLTGVDVESLLAQTLGAWRAPNHRPNPAGAPPVRADDAARVVIVDRPGSVQTELAIGAVGPDRRVEGGWAPHPVLAFVLGGSPNARIDAVLREDKGYTYGIRTSFRPRVHGGSMVTSGSVRAEVTAEALELVVGILATAKEGFTPEEVQSGVDFISRTAPGRYATADAIADEAAALVIEGLPSDFTTTNLRAVQALDPERLGTAYGRVHPQGWTIILVGDAATIADPVRTWARSHGAGEVSIVPASA